MSINRQRTIYKQRSSVITSEKNTPTKTPLPPQEETVDQLLNSFKKDSRLGFSEISDVDFVWNTEGDSGISETLVEGKGIKATGVLSQILETDSFFVNRNFFVDVNNVLIGTISASSGYRKGQTVCLVKGWASGGEEAFLRGDSRMDLEISCAELTPSNTYLPDQPSGEVQGDFDDDDFDHHEDSSVEIISEDPNSLHVSVEGNTSAKAVSVVVIDKTGTKRCAIAESDGERVVHKDGDLNCLEY